MTFREYWEQIYINQDELSSLIFSYWNEYSAPGTWGFSIVLSLTILPLILVYFFVDRKRIFEIFFFGYTVHMLWTYASLPLENNGYFTHHYFLTPYLPFSLNMTVSVLPVGFLFVYQYCTNKGKNFYLYAAALSALFAFVFATIEVYVGYAEFRGWMNQFYLFLIDMVIAVIAYWFTRLLLKVQRG
ncbi:hypothetical protein MM300_10610 [Evansella sp. LMS18]|jgi:hypothetical protein|uniref:hypothetical protein n=1 Tax=Evansella sp. LMS18 TaxID=2924033 RepID=UPI0020D0BCD5|nr:hypothetical protein [Evansella sp. LMS18]UTR12686.1 hypothetical protein MM300_10610 [Evansella sp. LMS18]